MCAGLPLPADPVALAALAGRISAGSNTEPGKRRKFDCPRCGAPLFGGLNENCQYCGPSIATPVVQDAAPIAMAWHGLAPEPSPAFPTWGGIAASVPTPIESGGAGASGSWDSGSTTPGTGD